MKPAPFRYVAAETLAHALALKAEQGDEARFLAGGQSLLPAMNFRLAQPAVVIDLNGLAELDFVRPEGANALRIGALTRMRTLEHDAAVAERLPLVREAVPHVAHAQIRNRGTLGGNLAHADPASELPAVALAAGARLRARSARGERWIDARDFFRGVYETALRADELLVEIEWPAAKPHSGTCFMEVARRQGDFALLGVAAVVALGPDGSCVEARLAFCNAAATPVVTPRAARALVGRRIGAADIEAVAVAVQTEIDPAGNVHASRAFQRHLAAVLTRRALRTALARADSAQ
jgi:CO/xanthine dehydrogenase FAD-binding subunit